MPPLLEIQQAFLASLRGEDDDTLLGSIVAGDFSASERLAIYRNSCRSVAAALLQMTYPAVSRLVGRDFFVDTAARFWTKHPPVSGYLNEYGGEFADFLASPPAAAAVPDYLADVARFEWALTEAANADDAPFLDLATLAEIDAERHEELRFEPHPSVRLLQLDYPADAITDAVLAGETAAIAAIDLASGPVRLVLNRGPNGVEACRLTAIGYDFARRLFAGEPLGRALEEVLPDGAMLLADHLFNGRLSDFRLGDDNTVPR